MAKLEHSFHSSDFEAIRSRIVDGILNGSMSASLEDGWDIRGNNSRCSVRVFERYSWTGENRVSMSVTLFQGDGPVQLCAITSGGSQAMFFKVNTWGEETFLDTLKDVLARI